DGWETKLPSWEPGEKVATRVASGDCINAVRDVVPGLMGGGADLTGNTGTNIKDAGVQTRDDPAGRLIYFGIREHGMGAVMNGIALHGGGLPFGGTFFNFSDYMRPAVRLAALSDAHVVYSWTHDSIGLGEDGPTHQPVEQLAVMRATPNLAYRDSVLLGDVPKLAVEALASLGWDRWADESVCLDRFGASAPGNIVMENLGFTGENVAARAKALITRKEGAASR